MLASEYQIDRLVLRNIFFLIRYKYSTGFCFEFKFKPVLPLLFAVIIAERNSPRKRSLLEEKLRILDLDENFVSSNSNFAIICPVLYSTMLVLTVRFYESIFIFIFSLY